MKKIAIVSIVILTAAIFLHKIAEIPETGEWRDIDIKEIAVYESAENYGIRYHAEEVSVINDNIGISFTVPETWNAKIIDSSEGAGVEMISPDLEKSAGIPRKGCEIAVGAIYFPEESAIGKRINEAEAAILIDGEPAVKTIRYRNKNTGGIISAEKPFEGGAHFFNISFPAEEESKCLEEFNNFLRSVSIKK